MHWCFFFSFFHMKRKECFSQQDNILSTRLAVFWYKSPFFQVSIFLPFNMFICRKKEAADAVEEKGSYQRTRLLKNSARMWIQFSLHHLQRVWGLVLYGRPSTESHHINCHHDICSQRKENRKEVEERKRHRWVIGCLGTHKTHSEVSLPVM